MSSNQELQQEELEVLRSIYDGDERFKEISSTVFQYKVGDEGDGRTVLLEVGWGEDYPEQHPTINMNTFYNKHLSEEVKSTFVECVKEQADLMLGMAMTYTLFEYVKENIDTIFSRAPQSSTTAQSSNTDLVVDATESSNSLQAEGSAKNKVKKEQLSKAQKRKLVNRQDINGEMSRGWNWVDVVKHLCQTGDLKMIPIRDICRLMSIIVS